MASCSTYCRAFLVIVTRFALTISQATEGGVLSPAIFDDNFCATPPLPGERGANELNTAAMDCARLMEFVYASRLKVWEQLEADRQRYPEAADAEATAEAKAEVLTWRSALRLISRGSSLISAHIHFLAAISSQRTECFSEHVRLLLIVNLRRLKSLSNTQVKQLWVVAQNGPEGGEEVSPLARKWLKDAAELLDADLRTMRTLLRTWRPPTPEEARFYSHEADGRFSTMESLRRDTFEEWQLDKGLLQGLVRHILPMDATVADFGAGSGQYANWLNDTGLVKAYAFDGSPDIELVTKNAVLSADLGRPMSLWRKFDWTICLEVAEHIPADLTATFLRNLDAHTEQGLVLSWARPGLQGLGNANPRSEAEVLGLVQQHTSLHLDQDLTAKLRATSFVAQLADSILVLVRSPGSSTCSPGDDTCAAALGKVSDPCGAEEGWIYAGNDVQMFSNIGSASACCELCRSNDLCRFWTWSREDSHKELCWIKSTREYRLNHDGFISGSRPA